MSGAPECRTLTDKQELRSWVQLTDRLYADAPGFVPPLRQQLRDFFEGEAPYLRHGEIEFLSVLKGDQVVARTTAHTNAKLDDKLGRRHLLFGFTEFIEDDGVFAALAAALEAKARAIGAEHLLGPVNLLPNQSGGVITSGFDRRGFVDSPYNLPYYPGLYERHGFERVFEGATYIVEGIDAGTVPVEQLFPFDDERIERERLEVRQADRKRVSEQLPFIRHMLNASFAQLDYYTEIDEDELAYQVDGLSYLLDERIALYLFKAGEPIAFVLCIPDISPFVRRINGNLNLPNQVRLLLTRKRYRREAILVIKGTVPDEQGKDYMRLLSRELLRNLREAGYRTARGTFVETENVASSSQADHMGGARLHGVTFYGRPVGHAGARPDLRSLRRLERSFYRAPSAHNTQPWVLDYARDRIRLRFDPSRHLPAGDPTRRDLLLSLGAFAEAVLIACASEGVSLRFEAAPAGDEVCAFVASDAAYQTPFTRDDLDRRGTSRLPYRPGRLPDEILEAARSQLRPSERLHELAARDVLPLFAAADRHLFESPATVEELWRWLRLSKRHPDYYRDGLTYECLDLSVFEARLLSVLLRPPVYRLVRATRLHRAFTSSSKALLDVDGSVLVLEREGDDPGAIVDSGRSLMRVWLELSAAGLSTHPLSQIIDHLVTEAELADRLRLSPGRRILNVFRAGRSDPAPRSHRLV